MRVKTYTQHLYPKELFDVQDIVLEANRTHKMIAGETKFWWVLV